jgi:DNA polymerase III subunit delta
MAAKTVKSDELFGAWAKGLYKPVYLFTGTEDFLIEEAVVKLRAHRLPPGEDINQDRLDAEDASVEEILQTCMTVPFLGSWRYVEVRNVSRLSSDKQKQLAAGTAKLPPTTQLVMIWGKEWRRDDAEKPLVEAAAKAGAVVIFWPMFPEYAQRWIIQRAKLYKKTLSPEAAAWLIQEAGEGLRRLDQELVKACLFVGDRAEITQEDIEACFGYERALSPYEWLTAVRQKNAARSMLTLKRLLEDDEEPLKLLAIATSSVREWVEAKEKGPQPWSRIPPAELEIRPMKELLEGISYCVEAHQNIKSGKETPPMALTLLTLRLCGLQTLHTSR